MKPLSLLFIICFCSNICIGQLIIWTEDFSNGLPSTWQNFDSISNAVWDWDDDPSAITFGAQPDFASATANNGFAIFDSDGFGSTAHDVRLRTDSIDCSALPMVYVRFENQYSYYSNTGSVAQLGVSNDGINFTYYTLFGNVLPNVLTDAVQIEEIDISTIAANQSTVYLEFRWQGFFEYAWKIDDITVQDGPTPLPKHNTKIGDYSIFTNYATPISQRDTMEFAAFVENEGTETQTNIKLITRIIETSENDQLRFIDSVTIPILNPGADTLLYMTNTYFPPDTGTFELSYEVTQDSADQVTFDNIAIEPFEITNDLFAKDNGTAIGGQQPNTGGDYQAGNLYSIRSGGFQATKAAFTVYKDPLNGILSGDDVNVFLYKVNDNILPDFSNFNVNSNIDLTVVGFANHTFTDEQNYDFVTVDLMDINTNTPGIELDSTSRYFLMVAFNGNSNVIFGGVSDALSYDFEIATIIQAGGTWFLGGYGPDITAVARLIIDKSTTTPLNIKPERIALNVFPNPTSDYINIDISTIKDSEKGMLSVFDIAGREVLTQNFEAGVNQLVSLNVTKWTSGVYKVYFKTENHQGSTSFIVK